MHGTGFAPCATVIDWDNRGIDLFFLESWFQGFWSAENLLLLKNGESAADLNVEAAKPGILGRVIVSCCLAEPEELVST